MAEARTRRHRVERITDADVTRSEREAIMNGGGISPAPADDRR